MKKPQLEHHIAHLIVKNLPNKIDIAEIQEYFNKKQLGITVFLGSYEVGKDGDKHIHTYSHTIYSKRYYTDHLKHPDWKFRLKFVKEEIDDKEKVLSYIFKDGDDYKDWSMKKYLLDYVENKDASLDGVNVFKVYHNAKGRREAGIKGTEGMTEKYINRYRGTGKSEKEILSEIINEKISKKLLIRKQYLRDLITTINVHNSEKFKKQLIKEILSTIL